MAEEFQESEIIFSDRDQFRYRREMVAPPRRKYQTEEMKKKKKTIASSLPVGIPQSIRRRIGDEEEEEFDEEISDDEEMLPPHVIVERRVAGKMAFSVCTGNGRTLKGRDLSQVRNSILRMTGFLEA